MFRGLVLVCTMVLAFPPMEADAQMTYALDTMPEEYELQRYDDCGMPGRQPHIRCRGTHEYNAASVNADRAIRTVAWEWNEVRAEYDDLDPELGYVVAVTYANEPFNDRAQSLWANDLRLHGPRTLPRGGWERLLLAVPRSETSDGKLTLRFRLEAHVNVVVSVVELWAAAAPPAQVHLSPVWALHGDVHGEVSGLAYDPLPRAAVRLETADGRLLASTSTDDSGAYGFAREVLAEMPETSGLVVLAEHEGIRARRVIPASDWHFQPLRYRPIPEQQAGLKRSAVLLDGQWSILTGPSDDAREMRLDDPRWQPFHVPGQWLQQGYDLPQDRTVAVARAFTVPAGWRGRRVFIRFEAIHAGTDYWLNGQRLGYSENLFTPVEWELTDHVLFGEPNRLDLEMIVDTPSERLSHSSGYAFHNLGGIDRSVHLFALPSTHLRDLRIVAGLDDTYDDGELLADATIDSPTGRLSLVASLSDGKRRIDLGAAVISGESARLEATVSSVLKWSAEKPNLYSLRVELRDGGRLLEAIERRIGFREIEVRGSSLYVNGERVKLAGACRHEIDPITGRADTARHAVTDVGLLKAANLNYIRTAHYPPTKELLEAADRLGMYVEVEAPFCWVGDAGDPNDLGAVLTPTSAMIDYCGSHPSVLLWSLANESQFNPLFEASAELCKELDPTRPTTFNNPDPKQLCDLANLHYAPMPYAQHLPGDLRPIILGEYFFPVCHEQTDVMVNPGLRELWGAGHSAPDSTWGRECAASYTGPYLQPGTPPGTWSYITRSDRAIGGAIWAALDEPFYLPDGRDVGYAWHHGFWGLIDAWRRPKPEWWLAKLIFSPVWFPERQVEFPTDVARVSVENRYSFTDLSELKFTWRHGRHRGSLRVDGPPGSTSEIEVPVPAGAVEGDLVILEVRDAAGELVNVAAIQLGERRAEPVPEPRAGAPRHSLADGKWTVEGDAFSLTLDAQSGSLAGEGAPVLSFPALHVTRYDFADLAPNEKPYEVLPHAETRGVAEVTVDEATVALVMTVADQYEGFEGRVGWRVDRAGVGRVSYDYTYHGDELKAREIGVRMLLPEACDELSWRRWSEWAVYPEDSISRTEGVARAHRDPGLGAAARGVRPTWPWALDETELGTNDFRSVKLNIHEAAVRSAGGSGVRVRANADAHVRACLAPDGVMLHVLSECRMGPVTVRDADRLTGEFTIELVR